jgi:hypothetical protein
MCRDLKAKELVLNSQFTGSVDSEDVRMNDVTCWIGSAVQSARSAVASTYKDGIEKVIRIRAQVQVTMAGKSDSPSSP